MEIKVYRSDETLTHLSLVGRLDHAGVELIESGFLAITSRRGLPSIIDMTEITFMVSIGMRMLIEAAKELEQIKAPFILVGPRGLVREALHIAKLDEIFRIVDTTEVAESIILG